MILVIQSDPSFQSCDIYRAWNNHQNLQKSVVGNYSEINGTSCIGMEEKEYQSYTAFDHGGEKEEILDQPIQDISNPTTPCTPAPCTPVTPNTSSTPASLSITDDTEHSQFSLSIDSGIESPQGFVLPGPHIQNLVNGRNNPTKPARHKISPTSKAADHTNKEKLRRERIKDSCDQLRVLLPYIRGRKTDMASVLEMCVEYLRIVNAFMPQTLQEQIVDILSKEPPIVFSKSKENKIVLPGQKDEISLSSASSLHQTTFITDKTPDFTLSTTENTATCDGHSNYIEDKSTKRLRLHDNTGTSPHFEDRNEQTGGCHTEVSSNYTFSGNQIGNIHLEDQSFGRIYSDGYSTAQQIFNNYTNNKNLQMEPDYLRPTYLDSYHFYPGVVNNALPQTRLYSTQSSEYVNPNAVLQTLPYSTMILKPAASSGKVDSYSSLSNVEHQKDDKSPRTP